jgi:very-short-patch-repair endonuclease
MANNRARQLRSNSTDAERKLWWHLRPLKRAGFHFRRQVPIDHLIVDFVCYSARVVIEVDGGQHTLPAGLNSDRLRDDHLRQNNFRVLRFWNNDVLGNIDGVMEIIRQTLGLDTPTPTPPRKGEGLSRHPARR